MVLFIAIFYLALVYWRFWLERKADRKVETIEELSESEFADLLKKYFIEKGFSVVREKENTLTLEKDHIKFIARFKKYESLINATEAREFRHYINRSGAKRGYYITTSDFTDACYREVENRLIELINGRQLLKMIKKYL